MLPAGQRRPHSIVGDCQRLTLQLPCSGLDLRFYSLSQCVKAPHKNSKSQWRPDCYWQYMVWCGRRERHGIASGESVATRQVGEATFPPPNNSMEPTRPAAANRV